MSDSCRDGNDGGWEGGAREEAGWDGATPASRSRSSFCRTHTWCSRMPSWRSSTDLIRASRARAHSGIRWSRTSVSIRSSADSRNCTFCSHDGGFPPSATSPIAAWMAWTSGGGRSWRLLICPCISSAHGGASSWRSKRRWIWRLLASSSFFCFARSLITAPTLSCTVAVASCKSDSAELRSVTSSSEMPPAAACSVICSSSLVRCSVVRVVASLRSRFSACTGFDVPLAKVDATGMLPFSLGERTWIQRLREAKLSFCLSLKRRTRSQITIKISLYCTACSRSVTSAKVLPMIAISAFMPTMETRKTRKKKKT
mmetsp:Transcript_17525/g.35895  ORF Transcript_17525/g.35895 Transcript_17525/m.35895 type:complete len:314 (-) Transcript_17525:171-1112(-)